MNSKKILRWTGLLIALATLLAVVFAPAPRVYADTTPGGVTCSSSGFTLNWILCPIFNGVSDMVTHFMNDFIVPFLKVPPVSTDPTSTSYVAWSNFRVYGDIFLVFAVIVVVFGQSIGGGLIDAYTAKKMLPRILVAAILINLSIYIVAFLVDLFNILGNGVSNIIIAPFANTLNFSPTAGQQLGVFGVGFLGLILAGGAIAGVIIAMFASFSTVALAAFFAVLPFIFAIIAIFFTLVFRQGLILLLVISSPVAFALYVLPNTEKLFRKWWDLMLEALAVYPIVLIVFAISDVLSGTVLQANGIVANNSKDFTAQVSAHSLAALIAFFMQIAPLFLIPFAFRIAGNTLSRGHDLVNRGQQAIGKMSQTRSQFAKEKFGNLYHEKQLQNFDRYKDRAGQENRGGLSRWYNKQLMQRAAGSNPELLRSRLNAQALKEQAEISDTGTDYLRRGLTVDKNSSEKRFVDAQGKQVAEDDENRAKTQYKSLGGAWVDEADVDEAQRVFGHSASAFQAAVTYEYGKAIEQEDMDNIVAQAPTVGRSLGLTGDQINGAMIGAGFAMQGKDLTLKNYRLGADGELHLNDDNLVNDIYQQKDPGSLLRQNANLERKLQKIIGKTQQEIDDINLPSFQPSAAASAARDNGDMTLYTAEQAAYTSQNADKLKQLEKPLERLSRLKAIGETVRPVQYPATQQGGNGGRAARPQVVMPNEEGEFGPVGGVRGVIDYAPAAVQQETANYLSTLDKAVRELQNKGVEVRTAPVVVPDDSNNRVTRNPF